MAGWWVSNRNAGVYLDSTDYSNIGSGLGILFSFWIVFVVISFIFSGIFALLMKISNLFTLIVNKVLPLKILFFPSMFDSYFKLFLDKPLTNLIILFIVLTTLSILGFYWIVVYKKYNSSMLKFIANTVLIPNIVVIIFRIPMYIFLSIYIAFVGSDDYHLDTKYDIQYISKDESSAFSHENSFLEIHHSTLFNKKNVEDLNGNTYDDFIVMKSGNGQQLVETPDDGFNWVMFQQSIPKGSKKLEFKTAFLNNIENKEDFSFQLGVRVNTGMENEKMLVEEYINDIKSINDYSLNIEGFKNIDIMIYTNKQVEFGILEMKFLVEESKEKIKNNQ